MSKILCHRHVFSELPGDVPGDAENTLSAEEWSRSGQFRMAADRRRYILARLALRRMLGNALGRQAADVRISIDTFGKPFCDGISFNLSHSHQAILIVLTDDAKIGVDVEHVRPLPDMPKLIENFFHAHEAEACYGGRPRTGAPDEAAFYTCWVRKEAVLKAIGMGLHFPLTAFMVNAGTDGGHPVLEMAMEAGKWADAQELEAPWSIRDVPMDGPYRAALAINREDVDITYVDRL